MNMNRNPRNPLKTNDRRTFYSIINCVFDDPTRIVVPPVPREAEGSESAAADEPRDLAIRHCRSYSTQTPGKKLL